MRRMRNLTEFKALFGRTHDGKWEQFSKNKLETGFHLQSHLLGEINRKDLVNKCVYQSWVVI